MVEPVRNFVAALLQRIQDRKIGLDAGVRGEETVSPHGFERLVAENCVGEEAVGCDDHAAAAATILRINSIQQLRTKHRSDVRPRREAILHRAKKSEAKRSQARCIFN